VTNNAGMQRRTPLEDFDPIIFNTMLQTLRKEWQLTGHSMACR